MPYPDKNALTPEIESQLKQGSKVFFKRGGMEYVGFIELNKWGDKFFVCDHNYDDKGILKFEGMRFYNRLEGMEWYSEFKILEI